MNVYVLAERLGKYAWQVLEEMPPDEYAHWVALEKIQERERKKQTAKQRARPTPKKGRR